MKTDKIIIGIVLMSFLIVGGGVFAATKFSNTPVIIESQAAKAVTVETEYAWGDIEMKNGVVTKLFTIKNNGTQDLELINIKTSCMCTTASISANGAKSPTFRMHQASSWKGIVAPRKEAQLEVIFDPAFHGPSGVGQITRQITVETNDASNKLLTFTVTANVLN